MAYSFGDLAHSYCDWEHVGTQADTVLRRYLTVLHPDP